MQIHLQRVGIIIFRLSYRTPAHRTAVGTFFVLEGAPQCFGCIVGTFGGIVCRNIIGDQRCCQYRSVEVLVGSEAMYLEKLGGVYINAYVQWRLGPERSALFVRQSLKTYMVQSRNVFGRVFAYEQLDVRFDGAGVYRVPNVFAVALCHQDKIEIEVRVIYEIAVVSRGADVSEVAGFPAQDDVQVVAAGCLYSRF